MRIPNFLSLLICLFLFACGDSTNVSEVKTNSATENTDATENPELLEELALLETQIQDFNTKILSFRERLMGLRPKIKESNVREENPAYKDKLSEYIGLGKNLDQSSKSFLKLIAARKGELTTSGENGNGKTNLQTFIDSTQNALPAMFGEHEKLVLMEKEITGMIDAALKK